MTYNDIMEAPLSPGESGTKGRHCGMEEKAFNSDELVDTEPLDPHQQTNSASDDYPALVRVSPGQLSPSRPGDMQHQPVEQTMTAPPFHQHQHHGMQQQQQQQQAMQSFGNTSMQPSMMWSVDPSVRHPGEKPKRPLSAYNFFFQLERERIIKGDIKDKDKIGEYTLEDVARIALIQQKKAKENKPKEKRSHRKTHGKISFGDLARTIANKWKKLADKTKAIFEGSASIEKERYKKELAEWNKQHKKWKDATTRMTSMAPMMYPDAGGYGIVTPTQMPKKTVLGGADGSESVSPNDAMAVAMMNQRLMNEYSGRSVAMSAGSHPGLLSTSQQSPNALKTLHPGQRRMSTGGMTGSHYGHSSTMDFFSDGGSNNNNMYGGSQGDNMFGTTSSNNNNNFSYEDVADDVYNTAASTLTPPRSPPGSFHHRAIQQQQQQMQMMVMQRIQRQHMQRQQMQQQQQQRSSSSSSSSPAMMQQMMMMNQYNNNNSSSSNNNGGMNEDAAFLQDDHEHSFDAVSQDKASDERYSASPEPYNPMGDAFGHEGHHHNHQV